MDLVVHPEDGCVEDLTRGAVKAVGGFCTSRSHAIDYETELASREASKLVLRILGEVFGADAEGLVWVGGE